MSNLQKYVRAAETMTGYRRFLGRVNDVAGRPHELLGSERLATYVRGTGSESKIGWGIGTVAGLVAGGIIGAKKGHAVVGSLVGASAFTNAPALLQAATRSEATWNMLQMAGAAATSLAMENNKALGFALGWVAVGAARYFYSGESEGQ